MRGKQPSGSQSHAHRLKIVWTDVIYFDNRLLPLHKRRATFDLKKHADVWAGERKETREAGVLDARQSLDARKRFLEIGVASRRIQRIAGAARRKRESQYAVRLKAAGN